MTRNPVTLFVLAIAMLLAPLGVCVGRGHVETGTAKAKVQHAVGAHGSASQGHGHSGHEGSGTFQHCADCQPPDYVSAGKAAADAGPLLASTPAFVPATPQNPPGWNTVPAHSWYGRAPPIPPPLPRATRIRLQI